MDYEMMVKEAYEDIMDAALEKTALNRFSKEVDRAARTGNTRLQDAINRRLRDSVMSSHKGAADTLNSFQTLSKTRFSDRLNRNGFAVRPDMEHLTNTVRDRAKNFRFAR